jgi:general secretion pathway protein J
MTRPAPSAGFTLLELLVAITVLALLTVLLFGGLQFGTRVWRLGDASLEQFQRVDATFELMRRSLMSASPKLVNRDPGDDNARTRAALRRGNLNPVVDFDGRPDGVSFVAPAPAAVLAGGYYRLTFAITKHEGVQRLTFVIQPLIPAADGSPAPAMEQVLIEGIDRARFSYFGHADDAEQPSWYDHWQNQGVLPEVISVQIAFPPGDRRIWPQLLVAPLVSLPLR